MNCKKISYVLIYISYVMPAHLKSSLIGASLNIPITNHQLNLGIW